MREEIGKRIEKIRVDMGMTKEKFAKNIGISGQFLGLVEHGKNLLSVEKLKNLCEFTNLSADYILFGKNTESFKLSKEILAEFSNSQIEAGLDLIKRFALFIKDE